MGKWYTKLPQYKGVVQGLDGIRAGAAGGLGIGIYINFGFQKPLMVNQWLDQFSILREIAYPLAIAMSGYALVFAPAYLDFVESMD